MFSQVVSYFSLLILMSVVMLATTGVTAILQPLQQYFETIYPSNGKMIAQLLLTIPSLATAFASFIIGTKFVNFNKWKLSLIGILGFSIFGSVPIFTSNIFILFLSRFCIGIFTSCIIGGVFGTVYIAIKNKKIFFSLQGLFMSSASMIFMSIIDLLYKRFQNWHMSFFTYTFCFIMAIPYLLHFWKYRKDTKQLNHHKEKEDINLVKIFKEDKILVFILLYIFLQAMFHVAYAVNLPFDLASKGIHESSMLIRLIGIYSLFALLNISGFLMIKAIGIFDTMLFSMICNFIGYFLSYKAMILSNMYVAVAFSGMGWGFFASNNILFFNHFFKYHNLGTNLVNATLYFGFFVAPFLIKIINLYSFSPILIYEVQSIIMLLLLIKFLIYKAIYKKK